MRVWLGLILLLLAPLTWAEISDVHHDIKITLDPTTRQLQGEATISFSGNDPVDFLLAAHFSVTSILDEDNALSIVSARGELMSGLRVWRIGPGKNPGVRKIKFIYHGELAPLESMDERSVLGALPALSDLQGSFLPAGTGWYPSTEGDTFTYRLELKLPGDQRGLAPGRLLKEEKNKNSYRAIFEFTHPAEGIDLFAGPYQVHEITRNGLRLRTYFHPEIAALAAGYLDSISAYIELYQDWIGTYPFTEFSVVSSPLPTGFGMPTLTYMGIDVLRLPFIRFGSLGHEVLHNWWANGVYVDWESGNWSEGLTTFMADYTYAEQKSAAAGRDMRLAWLRDFAALTEGQDQALRTFTSRSHSASRIVGYHKAAFLFLMLRDKIGEAAFDQSLKLFWEERQFRVSSWDDLRHAFEKSSGENLQAFFAQWLTREGAPRLTVQDATVHLNDDSPQTYSVAFSLPQPAPAYELNVPVVLKTANGIEQHRVELSGERGKYVLTTTARPLTLTLDPDFRVFRHIDDSEAPPILRQVMADPRTAVVIADQAPAVRAAGSALAERLLDYPPRATKDTAALPDTSALLLIGTHAEIDRFLAAHKIAKRPARLQDKGTAQVWTERLSDGKVIFVVSANDADSLQALLRPLPHYGKESFLTFDHAKVIERGAWPSQPREWPLSAPK